MNQSPRAEISRQQQGSKACRESNFRQILMHAFFDGAGRRWLGGVWQAKPGGLEPLGTSSTAAIGPDSAIGAVERTAARDEEATWIAAPRISRVLLAALDLLSSVRMNDDRSAKDTHARG